MSMTQFEKALIKELQGIKKELRELNKKEPVQGQVDGSDISIDSGTLSNAISNSISNNLSNSFR